MSGFHTKITGLCFLPDDPPHDPSRNGEYRGPLKVLNLRPNVTGEDLARARKQRHLERVTEQR